METQWQGVLSILTKTVESTRFSVGIVRDGFRQRGLNPVLIFLTSLRSTKHDLLSFQMNVSKSNAWKGKHFHGRLRATLTLATPLIDR